MNDGISLDRFLASMSTAVGTRVVTLLASAGHRVIVPHLRGYGTTRSLSDETFRNSQPSALAADVIVLREGKVSLPPPSTDGGWSRDGGSSSSRESVSQTRAATSRLWELPGLFVTEVRESFKSLR